MWQFILDMCWYGNANLSSLQMVSLSIGIVLSTVWVSSSFYNGSFKHKPTHINDIAPNQHAVATGTIAADTPIENDGTHYAYIPQENDKPTGVLSLYDHTGKIDILLDDAIIAMSSDEPPLQTIHQDSTIFVRGFVNEDRVFASTYFTFTKTEDGPAVDTAIEIQRDPFTQNVRSTTAIVGCFMLLSLILFGGYPLYKHYTFWQQPFTDTVVNTSKYRERYTLEFDSSPSQVNVIEDVYDACPIGETVKKEAQSLTAWCGDDRQAQSIAHMPLKRQLWENTGLMVLLGFMGFGALLMRRTGSKN